MAGKLWSPKELDKLEKEYSKKPEYTTDYEWAMKIAPQFKRSVHSVRWQFQHFHEEVNRVSPARILLLDIETLPIEAEVWGVWNQNINPIQIKKDWSIVSWAAKWLFTPYGFGQVVKPEEAVSRKDDSILAKIWELVNNADIVIHHNGIGFDMKRLNTRWLLAGFPPPMYYQNIDTLKVVKDNFDFTYNKMDYINAILGIDRKIPTNHSWWTKCGNGDKKTLQDMLDYNMQDVEILEELYLKIRPWISRHPNLNLFSVGDMKVCPNCGGGDLHWNGKYTTPLGLYRGFRCESCGAIGRSTKKAFKLKGSEVSN